jgi:hypothetical protein
LRRLECRVRARNALIDRPPAHLKLFRGHSSCSPISSNYSDARSICSRPLNWSYETLDRIVPPLICDPQCAALTL